MTEPIKPQRVRIGGLWKNETKKGISFLSGNLSYDSVIEIWPNKKRDGKKDPDFQIFISQKIKRESSPFPSSDSFGDVRPDNIEDVPF